MGRGDAWQKEGGSLRKPASPRERSHRDSSAFEQQRVEPDFAPLRALIYRLPHIGKTDIRQRFDQRRQPCFVEIGKPPPLFFSLA